MNIIQDRNVNQLYQRGMQMLAVWGRERSSRNGDVLVADGPVTSHYLRPNERVLFDPARDANPFFHLYEGLWMLAGCRDVARMEAYVPRMATFSDDGEVLHGAYGYRWREHFGRDQLPIIAEALRNNPDDRRCVLQMWHSEDDLAAPTKDAPCNTHVYFSRNWLGRLDMTVCCRSNDIVWGCYGANAVHFSMLQEFMAAAVGCSVGEYWQISNNWHGYRNVYDGLLGGLPLMVDDPYTRGEVVPLPMVRNATVFLQEVVRFILATHPTLQSTSWLVDELRSEVTEPFLRRVAMPMHHAYFLHKHEKKTAEALDFVSEHVQASDWRLAARLWLLRRLRKKEGVAECRTS